MKKLLLLSSVALSAMSVCSAWSTDKNILRGDPQAEPRYTGLYGGIHLGFSPSRLKIDHYDNPTHQWTKQKTASPSSAIGGLHLGYQYRFSNCLVAGIEGFFDRRSMNQKNKFAGEDDKSEKYDSEFAYGAAIKLGLKIKEWTPYAKVGIDFTHLEHNHSYRYLKSPAVPAHGDQPAKEAVYDYHVNTASKNHKGLLLALGVSYDINARFTLGAEFKHTQYNAKIYTPKPSTQNAPAVAYSKKVKPSVSSIMGTLTVRL